MSLFTKSFVVDLGTSTTQVYQRGAGVVLDEPSLVAVDKPGGKIVAVGNAAKSMTEKNPDNVIIIKPMSFGAVADYDLTRNMIKSFLRKCPSGLAKPRVTIIASGGITEVEKKAVKEAFMSAGAKSASFVNKGLVSALMAGVLDENAGGSMVIDIGGGTTELALLSFGGVISSKSIKVGGDSFDSSIKEYIRKNHGIVIGVKSAENVKCSLANTVDGEITACGRDIKTGLPKTIFLCPEQIKDAMRSCFTQISDAADSMLEEAPVDLVADIKGKGIVVTGGGGKLCGICSFLSDRLNIPVRYSMNDDPGQCCDEIIRYAGGRAI